MPLIFLVSKEAVGKAEGFCLNEPVPIVLSFEGLITEEAAEGVVELLLGSAALLTDAVAFEVDDVVEVDVAAAVPDEEAVEDEEPAVSTEGDLIEEDRPLEPLGV